MQDLELAIHHHQSLYEQVTQAYTEVRTKRGNQRVTSSPGHVAGWVAGALPVYCGIAWVD
jgi:hypothetical protein